MFAAFEWLLAMRYLRARRKEGFISVIAGFSFIGIMLGVATLIIVMAVMNGFRAQLFDKILGLNGHVAAFQVSQTGAFEGYDAFAGKLRNVPGVVSATPLIEGQVMVSSPAQALGGLVRGITEDGLSNAPLVSGNIVAGTLDGFDGQKGIALGTRLAEALRLSQGDFVTLISPRGNRTPFGVAPRSRSYRVAAIFEMGMSEYDKTMLFLPLAEAQSFFSKPGRVDVVEVKVEKPDAVERQLSRMRATFGETAVFQSWKQRNQTFFTVLEVERTVMFIILSLIILVAALNIISGMMMLVKDKSRDIAILRTMGATKGAMMRVFLITGAAIGVVGTLCGLVLGIVFCWNIEAIRQFVQWMTGTTLMDPAVYYLTRLPAEIDAWETAFIVVMALSLSVLATIYPSLRAAALDPVEALRYE
ncbi:MAG: lipoprotein-releasing ABC transporter permease subunit [Pseudomonadota bacterium]